MSTPTLVHPTTAGSFLFGAGEGRGPTGDALSRSGALRSVDGVLGALGAAARRAVLDRFATSVNDLLGFDLTDLLASGWRKYERLRDAAVRTLSDPTTAEMVELLSHRITSVQRPTVDLYLDDVRAGTLHLEVDFEFEVRAVVAEVRAGRLVALHHGQGRAAGTLSAEGIQVARREAAFDPALTARLGDGIPLLSDEPSTHPTILLPEA
jgi:hypothetical protein